MPQRFIEAYSHHGKIGVLIELVCETSMPLRDRRFTGLARDIAMQVAAENPRSIAELRDQRFIRQASISVAEQVERVAAGLSEAIEIGRYLRWDLSDGSESSIKPLPPPVAPIRRQRLKFKDSD